MKIRIDRPMGEFPAVSPRALPPNAGQMAKNCKFGNGQVRPLRTTSRVNTPTKAGTKLSIFRWGNVVGGDASGVITLVSNMSPVRITSNGHGLLSGARVYVTGTGLSIDNATRTITVIDANTFSLDGTTASGASATGSWVKENGYWFHSTSDVNYARGPIANDVTEVVYFTGESEPRMTYNPIAVSGGGTGYPNNWYRLGIPAPTVAPTVAAGAGGGCDVATQVDRFYVYTFVSGFTNQEEGPPSQASALITVCPGQTVNLSGMALAPSGNYNITHRRIYRLVVGNASAEFQFVAELPIATTSYADSMADSDLGGALQSTNWDPPPDNLKGLVMHPNGFAVGFSGNMLCPSEFNQPHAWPGEYQIAFDHDIVAIGLFDDRIVVCTTHETRIVTGNDPSLLDKSMPGIEHTCINKRSLRSLGEFGAVFVSPVGLISISANGSAVASAMHFDYDAWQALRPESMHGYVVDGKYVCFYDTGLAQGGLIFDPARAELGVVRLDLYATAGYVDPQTEALYLMINGHIERFDSGTSLLSASWKSAKFETPPVNFGAAQVLADSYGNMTFKLTAGGALRHTRAVTNDQPFRLPGGYLAETAEIEIVGTDSWNTVMLATDMDGLS